MGQRRHRLSTVVCLTLVALVASILRAAKPVSDPIDIQLNGPNVFSDGGVYEHGDGGVHAAIPPTGNIVLDPDRNAKKKGGRTIMLGGTFGGPSGIPAGFMSVNSLGVPCTPDDDGNAPGRMTREDCVVSMVSISEIDGVEGALECGDDPNLQATADRSDLHNVHVSCTIVVDGGCTEWIITPAPENGGAANCALFEWSRGKLRRVDGTVYDMRFDAVVNRPE